MQIDRIDFVSRDLLTIDEAGKLEAGARVKSAEHGAIGEVVPARLPGILRIDWKECLHYDRRLRDYIGSSEWDLLDLDDWSETLPLHRVR